MCLLSSPSTSRLSGCCSRGGGRRRSAGPRRPGRHDLAVPASAPRHGGTCSMASASRSASRSDIRRSWHWERWSRWKPSPAYLPPTVVPIGDLQAELGVNDIVVRVCRRFYGLDSVRLDRAGAVVDLLHNAARQLGSGWTPPPLPRRPTPTPSPWWSAGSVPTRTLMRHMAPVTIVSGGAATRLLRLGEDNRAGVRQPDVRRIPRRPDRLDGVAGHISAQLTDCLVAVVTAAVERAGITLGRRRPHSADRRAMRAITPSRPATHPATRSTDASPGVYIVRPTSLRRRHLVPRPNQSLPAQAPNLKVRLEY
jgi:hypothetical protein